MKDIYIVCVLYNKLIQDIASYEAFVEATKIHDHVHFMVVDNSNEEYVTQNEIYMQMHDNIIYVGCGGNVGLSKAYNRGLRAIQSEMSDAFMMIADDDTIFSLQYLDNLIKACAKNESDIYAGIIRDSNGKYLSPNTAFDWLGRDKYAVKEPGSYENLYCFNSGLCLSTVLLNTLGGFDEQLFVDMIDYWLMDTLIAKKRNKICIVEGEIIQDFSATTFQNLESVVRRYQIFKKDFEIYCDLCDKSSIFRWYYGRRRKLNVLLHILMKGRFDLVKEL